MARRSLSLFFVISVVFACLTTLALQPACNDIPSKTCFGDKVNALIGDGGSDPRASACTTCMQRTECCDLLGTCGDDPECTAEFKETQECTLRTGKEAECKPRLVHDKSKALYACVRKPCGSSCGIPSCDLNQAVPLIGSPTCDRCMGGSCCEEINACYNSRPCKLFLECVSNSCPRTLGLAMAAVGRLAPEAIEAARKIVCGEDAGVPFDPALQQRFDPGPCLNRCLEEFTGLDAGGIASENLAARCRSVSVYTCGARNGCGPGCTNNPVTASEYPEDQLPDAGPADSGTE